MEIKNVAAMSREEFFGGDWQVAKCQLKYSVKIIRKVMENSFKPFHGKMIDNSSVGFVLDGTATKMDGEYLYANCVR